MSDVNITVTDGTTPTTITVFDGVFVAGGGGGGDVASVNGKVGVVVLGASDVGAQPVDTDLTAIAALSTTAFGRSLLTAADAAGARALTGAGTSSFDGTYAALTGKPTLGTAAAAASTDFQPVDSDLTAIAALTTTVFGRSLLTAADAAGARSLIGAGTSSLALGTSGTTAAAGNDSRLSDARTPTAHASTHASAGSDPITIAESQVTNLTTDLAAKAPLASPTFTGTPAAPTATAGTNTTQVATTAFVTAAVVGAGGYVDPLTTKGDIVARSASATVRKAVGSNGAALFADSAQTDGLNWRAIAESDVTNLTTDLAAKAPTASPTFTGTVTIPTATAADSSTKAASTAYVQGELTAKAPLASPTFTGTPAVPTASAGTNTTQAASTAFVKAALDKQAEWTTIALSDESTAITTGTAKVTWRAPMPLTLTGVRASVSTASSSGLPTVDIKKNGTTVLSTLLTIDATEKTSVTAATAAVISVTSVSDDDEITFDVTVAGTGTKGLKVTLYWTRA